MGGKRWHSDGRTGSHYLSSVPGSDSRNPIPLRFHGDSGRVDLFVRGTGGSGLALWHNFWNGDWNAWEPLKGILHSPPEVVSRGPGLLDIVVLGSDNRMYQKSWVGRWVPSQTGWRGPFGEGVGAGRLSLVHWGPQPLGRLDVFGIGTARDVLHMFTDDVGQQWLPHRGGVPVWERLGAPPGGTSGTPVAVSWGPHRLDIFVFGVDGRMFHKAWDGRQWLPSKLDWDPLGDQIFSSTTFHIPICRLLGPQSDRRVRAGPGQPRYGG
jgi:hypothetical protein